MAGLAGPVARPPGTNIPYGGENSPVRQRGTVEPWQWGLGAIWTRDGKISVDGEDGCFRLVYEAPCTGYAYGRDGCSGWVPVLTKWEADCFYAPITTVPFVEAPADGNLYLRNGSTQSWVQNGAAPGTISEAPLDGNYYLRHMGQWVQIDQVPNLVTFAISGGTY
jgi:hypothetical protein